MFKTSSNGEEIEFLEETITQEAVDKFAKATHSNHIHGIPPTFATLFRHPEYEWLNRLEVDMRYLLHSDQEYEYRSPLEVGKRPVVRTRILEVKERKRKTEIMRFIKMESEIGFENTVSVVGRTTFLVRQPLTEKK